MLNQFPNWQSKARASGPFTSYKNSVNRVPDGFKSLSESALPWRCVAKAEARTDEVLLLCRVSANRLGNPQGCRVAQAVRRCRSAEDSPGGDEMSERVYTFASSLLAACPGISAPHALRLALRFTGLIEEVRQLRRETEYHECDSVC